MNRCDENKNATHIIFVCALIWGCGLLSASNHLFAAKQVEIEELLRPENVLNGPCVVSIGSIAELQVPKGYRYLPKKFARQLSEIIGEGKANDSQLEGILFPENYMDWEIRISSHQIGYVETKEQQDLNADEIANSIRAASNQQNTFRREVGMDELFFKHWILEPQYDGDTNHLPWAFGTVSSSGDLGANFDVRVLGRNGLLEVKLVSSADSLESLIPTARGLIHGLKFKSGHTYSEWASGDRIAEVGLIGLITGGSAVVAAKSGMLVKLWKVILGVIIAIGIGFNSFFSAKKKKTA